MYNKETEITLYLYSFFLLNLLRKEIRDWAINFSKQLF